MCESKAWQVGWWLIAGAGVVAFLLAPEPLPDKLMALAAGVCPQRAGHSYFLAGLQLPLEARMLGIFGGFLGTALYAWLGGLTVPLPGRARFAALLVLLAPTVADGLNATAYDFGFGALYQPDNAIRLATGLLAGVATALLFLPLCSAWVWRAGAARSASGGWRAQAGPFGLAMLVWLAPVAGWDWAYYPLALLATGGLVLAAALLNLLLILSVSRRKGTIAGVGELANYGLLALAMVAAELTALAALRFAVLDVYLG